MATPRHPTLTQSYAARASLPNTSPIAAYLLRLIAIKRTNLCLSADVTTTAELLQLADQVGDHICLLKTHADIVRDFGERTIKGLRDVARRKHFLIFEDRKFGDIGSTVQKQYTAGPLTIVRWATIVNAHIFPGPSIITALSSAAETAIAAYNTAVHTEISGPSPITSSNSDYSPVFLSDDDDEDDDDDSSDDDSDPPQIEPPARSQSIVSVSTTISTRTEPVSPQPQPHPRPLGLPTRDQHHQQKQKPNDAEEEEEQKDEPTTTSLHHLGPPPFHRALLLLAEMSSEDNLLTPAYTAQCLAQARANRPFVIGFIAQRSLNCAPGDNFISMTPGVQLPSAPAIPGKAAAVVVDGDGLGQQYNTPARVVGEAGADVIIVGRGILKAGDRRAAAGEYRRLGWAAYEKRIGGGGGVGGRR
ncbi:orotidine 5'-phosphate decarboxylase [Elasticomyces elasticus]|nr:orotidine 5'-phosphate decarboxylase [Elasticomyces elasticus]